MERTSGSADRNGPTARARVVYLVMSHTNPAQVLRLCRTLRALSPNAQLVVHHDERAVALDRAALDAVGGIHYLRARRPIQWGDLSQVEALFDCLRWIVDNIYFDWVVHMSGQDYPIRPLAELEARLADGAAEAYLKHELVGDRRAARRRLQDANVRRYFFHYVTLPGARLPAEGAKSKSERDRAAPGPMNTRGTLVRRLTARLRAAPLPIYVRRLPRGLGRRLGYWAPTAPFPPGYACYKGSYWTILSRRAVTRLLDGARANPKLLKHYRRTLNPDESVVPTLLLNDGGVAVENSSLRFTSWASGQAHPELITLANLQAVLGSGHFFARKFDSGADEAVLDAIDRRLAGTSGLQLSENVDRNRG